MQIDLRSRTVQPGKELEHEFGIGRIVFPVDLIGIFVVSVDGAIGAFVDDRVDDHVDDVLSGTVFRAVDRAGDTGSADDVAGSFSIDFYIAVDFPDEVVDIRHHFDGAGYSQDLLIAAAVFDTVDDGVHVVAFDDAHDPWHDVVRLYIFQNVELGYHVILSVILNESERAGSLFGFRRCESDASGKDQKHGKAGQYLFHAVFPPCNDTI